MKLLIIGIDLSFNSTGITNSLIENDVATIMEFHKIVFDDESNISGKPYTPKTIKNLNVHTYTLLQKFKPLDPCVDDTDLNNFEQLKTTLRAMSCSNKISHLIADSIEKYKPEQLIVCLENYIMPSFGGQNSLKNVSVLIILQGFVREFIINYCFKISLSVKMLTPSPTSVKLFFCRDGQAEKDFMVYTFINEYDGKRLLPSLDYKDTQYINDVVDSFALNLYAYSKMLKK
jgi:hypothetical protein